MKMSHQLELLSENSHQWNAVIRLTPEIQKKEIKPFVLLTLKELEGTPDERTSSLVHVDKFAAVRQVVRHVVRQKSALREGWSREEMLAFLETLCFSPECCVELSALLTAEQIYDSMPQHCRLRPGLANLQWKIDFSLCQSTMNSEEATTDERRKEMLHRCVRVILTLTLTNQETRTYRLSVVKFHELRFAVANALKSIIILERRKCMKKD